MLRQERLPRLYKPLPCFFAVLSATYRYRHHIFFSDNLISMGRGSPKKRDMAAPRGNDLLRGTVQVLPEGELQSLLAENRPLRIKLGVDPTAPDIHLGHVVVLRKLREFQDMGHSVVLIIGDFTSRVGDPSGRMQERPMLSEAEITENAKTYQEQVFRILDPKRTEIRRNSEWLNMETKDLLSLLSSATVSSILAREDFQNRLKKENPISILEMIYPLLQGYDSVAVDSDVEIGGTDQTFNLLFARDVQSAYDKKEQVILTVPILPGLDGKEKMSKSKNNYVAVDDSPEEIFGKIMSIPDSALSDYWNTLFFQEPKDLSPRDSKRSLARKVVELLGGEGKKAEQAFDNLFLKKEVPSDIPTFSLEGEGHLPSIIASAFSLTRSEARRLISQGGVKLDGEVVHSLDLQPEDLDSRVLQVGKRKFVRLYN